MIFTLTLNPSLDYMMSSDLIDIGEVNRSKVEKICFGGKGLNVSAVLKELGIDSVALGFVGGFSGAEIRRLCNNAGIRTDFVELKQGFSRINVKLRHGRETDINASGPVIGEEDFQKQAEVLKKVKSGDTVVICGSVPRADGFDLYEEILRIVENKEIKLILDVSGSKLIDAAKRRPFLIKPNTDELGEAFGTKIKNIEDVSKYASVLKSYGAQNVLVSMAADGAFLIDSDGKTHICGVAEGKRVNSVGAGDSMVAGFLAGYAKTKDYDYALKLGTASGGATTFCEGLATGKQIFDIMTSQF